jgi:hypothetical protein
MDYDDIRQLVQKYWAGETDLDDEAYLKDFFSKNAEIPEDLVAEKYLFMAYRHEASQPKLTEDLVTKIEFPTKTRVVPIWKQVIKYAAVVLPLAIVGYIMVHKNQKQTSGFVIPETIKNKDQAVKEVSTALQILSTNMRDGLENVKQLDMLKDIGLQLNEKQTQKKQK